MSIFFVIDIFDLNFLEVKLLKEENRSLDKDLLMALLNEIRNLREQLQQSIDANNALREKLENELGHPVSVSALPKTPYLGQSVNAKRNLFSTVLYNMTSSKPDMTPPDLFDSPDETPTKDYGKQTKLNFSWLRTRKNILRSLCNSWVAPLVLGMKNKLLPWCFLVVI